MNYKSKIKDYFWQWGDNYHLVFRKSRLLSQIPIFILAISGICESGEILYTISKMEFPLAELAAYGALPFLIPLFLSTRFLLLFARSKRLFLISQVTWLMYFALFINIVNFQATHCLSISEAVILLYFLGSFVRQVISLCIPFFLVNREEYKNSYGLKVSE